MLPRSRRRARSRIRQSGGRRRAVSDRWIGSSGPFPLDSVASTSRRLLQRRGAVRALAQHHAIAATQQLVEPGLRSFFVHAGLSGSRSTPSRRTAPSFAGRRASASRALRRSSVERSLDNGGHYVRSHGPRAAGAPIYRAGGLERRVPADLGSVPSTSASTNRGPTHVLLWREHRPAALRRPAGASSAELDIFLS